MKVAHIYASDAKTNSGDYILGIATKWYFKYHILETNDITFTDLDCRNNDLFNNQNIHKLNDYDYILIGGGGLILPDTMPNRNSGWQWNISTENILKIGRPIFVMSIGYNLFFNQEINMPDRESNKVDNSLTKIFTENIIQLINKSVIFSLRHKEDIEKLLSIIGEKFRNKIDFQKCPSIDYIKYNWKSKLINIPKKYIAIEIKDDREWRRYYKIGKVNYYNELLKFVKILLNDNKNVCYLSHDGSKNFYNFLKNNSIILPLFDCSIGNEERILYNYSQIHTILCSAGHSQMFSYALGIRPISMITHPKLQYFCEDFNLLYDAIDVNNNIDKLFNIKL